MQIRTRAMERILLTAGLALALAGVALGGPRGADGAVKAPAAGAAPTEKITMKILYVGVPETARQRDFVSFLSERFTEVRSTDVTKFEEQQAKGYDVVLLDKDGEEWGSKDIDFPLSKIHFSEGYSCATISLGIPGAFFASKMDLKPGYR